jgi:hypothetical protein
MPELHQQPFVLVVDTVTHGAAHAYVAKQITLYAAQIMQHQLPPVLQALRSTTDRIEYSFACDYGRLSAPQVRGR